MINTLMHKTSFDINANNVTLYQKKNLKNLKEKKLKKS